MLDTKMEGHQRTYLAIDLKSFYAAVECVDPEKSQVWTDLVGPGMHVRTAVEMASAFREVGFAGVAAKVDPKSGIACVFGRNDGGGGL